MEGGKGEKDDSSSSSSNKFPAGLRILVVDDDRTCLKIVEKMLKKCRYEVTACQHASNALSILREGKSRYDVVLTDVHMPDMDGFKLLEFIGLEMNLPVVMMSADCDVNVARKGLEHGACYYLMKPLSMDEIKNIWQHTIRKKKDGKEIEKMGSDGKEMEKTRSAQENNAEKKASEEVECESSVNEKSTKHSKRRKEAEEEEEDDSEEHEGSKKKPRVNWDSVLHTQFLHSVDQIGIDRAVPKKILELMNVPWLTRENVASHLQKYRLFLRKLNDANGCHATGVFSPTPLKSRHGFISPHFMSNYQNQTTFPKLSEPSNLMGFQQELMGNTQNFSACSSINPMQFPSQDLQNNPSLAGLGFGQSMLNTTGNMQRVPQLSSSKLGSAQSFLQQREGSRGFGMLPQHMRMGSSSLVDAARQRLVTNNSLDGFNMENDQNNAEFSFSKVGTATGIPFSRLNQPPTLNFAENHSGLHSMINGASHTMNPVGGAFGEASSDCSMSGYNMMNEIGKGKMSIETEEKDILPELYSVDLSFIDHGLDRDFSSQEQHAGSFSNVDHEQNILGMGNTSRIEGDNLSDILKSSGF